MLTFSILRSGPSAGAIQSCGQTTVSLVSSHNMSQHQFTNQPCLKKHDPKSRAKATECMALAFYNFLHFAAKQRFDQSQVHHTYLSRNTRAAPFCTMGLEDTVWQVERLTSDVLSPKSFKYLAYKEQNRCSLAQP